MYSEGVSVWFACKLCNSFFLNADDFAYHKKKYHVQEFQNTKFIVFEEQTTPTASPPENWVSFLLPKEETQIHKIVFTPPPPIISNVDDCDTNTINNNVKTNSREEFIKINSESNFFISNNRGGRSYDESQVSNNCFELNSTFTSNDEADKTLFAVGIQENDLEQSTSIPPTSAVSNLTDTIPDKIFSSSRTKATLKSTTNNLKRSNKKILNVVSKKTLLQTVIQPPNKPKVYLKRLNFRTIQSASLSQPNISNTIDFQENNSSAKSAKQQPKVKDADQTNIITSNSDTFPSPPLVTVTMNCKFCSKHFYSASELDIHEDICLLRSQFENILCVPCLLTFTSSDELIRHNQEFHFVSISNPTPETIIGHRTAVADDLKFAPKHQTQSDILSNVSSTSTSSLAKLPLSIKTGDHLHNIDLHAFSNADTHNNYSGTPNPNLNYGDGDLVEVVKTEYLADETEDCELPNTNEEHDPFESVSSVEVESSASCSLKKEGSHYDEPLPPQSYSSRYCCVSCQKYFVSVRDLKTHSRTHHTQDGKAIFTCPHTNCGKTTKTPTNLNLHIMQVHSNVRPFKCWHPGCTMSFKTTFNRNRHSNSKVVHLQPSSCQVSAGPELIDQHKNHP